MIDLPAPPPPSPEPADKPKLSTHQEEESTPQDTSTTNSNPHLATAAVIDMSDFISDLPPANQSEAAPYTASQSEADLVKDSQSAVPKFNTELTQISQLTEQSTLSVDDAAAVSDSKEGEGIREKMELDVGGLRGEDAYSRVPDYEDMDMDR